MQEGQGLTGWGEREGNCRDIVLTGDKNALPKSLDTLVNWQIKKYTLIDKEFQVLLNYKSFSSIFIIGFGQLFIYGTNINCINDICSRPN